MQIVVLDELYRFLLRRVASNGMLSQEMWCEWSSIPMSEMVPRAAC
jgi:hypothetical protein